MSMKQGGIVKNPFQTELFERFSELSPPNINFPGGCTRKALQTGKFWTGLRVKSSGMIHFGWLSAYKASKLEQNGWLSAYKALKLKQNGWLSACKASKLERNGWLSGDKAPNME
jgi:hypothetical protein